MKDMYIGEREHLKEYPTDENINRMREIIGQMQRDLMKAINSNKRVVIPDTHKKVLTPQEEYESRMREGNYRIIDGEILPYEE